MNLVRLKSHQASSLTTTVNPETVTRRKCNRTQNLEAKHTCDRTSQLADNPGSGTPFWGKWKRKHSDSNPMAHSKSSLRGKFIAKRGQPQETRKTSNAQSNLTPKGTTTRTKPKVCRRKEIIRSKAEINKIETKKNH